MLVINLSADEGERRVGSLLCLKKVKALEKPGKVTLIPKVELYPGEDGLPATQTTPSLSTEILSIVRSGDNSLFKTLKIVAFFILTGRYFVGEDKRIVGLSLKNIYISL